MKSLNRMIGKEVIRTLRGNYRLFYRSDGKFIQKRIKGIWQDVETWPYLADGGTIVGAAKFMDVLEDRDNELLV